MSSPPDHQCECVIPPGEKTGWCERHGMYKTAHWIELCRTRPSYRNRWDEGCGPGQNHAREVPGERPSGSTPGVGALVRRTLGCSAARAAVFAEMDVLGQECEDHLERLAKETAKAACKRCGGVSEASARRIILHAVSMWRTQGCQR